ncbi:MAG: methyl-accepting chemotaxis protein [Lachnospiraceae bacterium]|nr:methyl-accepting chemotaxis protein [Lachnospiraceae bacterium]
MKNASIRIKLASAALSILFAGVVGLVLLGMMLNKTVSEMEDIYYEELYSVNDLALTADRDLYVAGLANKQYVDEATSEMPNADVIANNKSAFSSAVGSAYSAVKAIEKVMVNYPELGEYNFEGTDINACIDSFEENFMSWKALADPSKASTVDNYSKAVAMFSSVSEPVTAMGTIVKAYVDEKMDDYKKTVGAKILLLYAIVAVIMIVTVIYTIFVVRYIRTNLSYVANKFNAIAENDLTAEIKELDTKDEIGTLNKAAREMQTHLRNVIASIKESSVLLGDSSREMDRSSVETSESVTNINNAASELANTATGQASDIADISKHMAVVDDMMRKNTENTDALAEVSDTIRAVTEEGTERVISLKDITEQSVDAFEKIFDIISGIEKSTTKISEASNLISAIADQTNLLSLNASIEAARAGDAGRGFAVVADEIRNLAAQSTDSVNIINEMLADLQHNTEDATSQSANVRECVNKQKEAVDMTSQSFTDIAGGIQQINATVDELHGANRNLSEGVGNISNLISKLAEISEENAETANKLNAATDSVNANVDMLSRNGNRVSTSAQTLEEVVSVFKIN